MRWTDKYPSKPGRYRRARRRGEIDIVRIGTDGTGYGVSDGFTTIHQA